MFIKTDFAPAKLALMFGVFCCIFQTPSQAQMPALYWAESVIDGSLSACATKAAAALTAENIPDVQTGTIGTNLKWTNGKNDRYNAWIVCNDAPSPVVFTVMVAGPSEYGKSTEDMKFRLRDFMLDRNPPPTNTTSGGTTTAGGPAYRYVQGGYISGHNMRQIAGTVDDCKAACDRDARCKSFDYWVNDSKCDLSDYNSSMVRIGENSSKWDYYEKNIATIVDYQLAAGKAIAEDWCLGCNGSSRQKSFAFSVREPVRNITVRVYHGEDDSGDRRVDVLLYEPGRKVVLSESTGSSGWVDWTVPAGEPGQYELVLRDLDTQDGGRYPGNGGKVEVLLE